MQKEKLAQEEQHLENLHSLEKRLSEEGAAQAESLNSALIEANNRIGSAASYVRMCPGLGEKEKSEIERILN